jgi:hypothetical protein
MMSKYIYFPDIFLNDIGLNLCVYKALDGNRRHIGELLHHIYKHTMGCVLNKETKEYIWYMYDDHKWTLTDNDTVKQILADKLHNLFETADKYYLHENHTKTSTVIHNTMHKFDEKTFRDNMLKELQKIFYGLDLTFGKKLNKKAHLIVFKNGVYDLKSKQFRQGTPNDYITEGINYDYVSIKMK